MVLFSPNPLLIDDTKEWQSIIKMMNAWCESVH